MTWSSHSMSKRSGDSFSTQFQYCQDADCRQYIRGVLYVLERDPPDLRNDRRGRHAAYQAVVDEVDESLPLFRESDVILLEVVCRPGFGWGTRCEWAILLSDQLNILTGFTILRHIILFLIIYQHGKWNHQFHSEFWVLARLAKQRLRYSRSHFATTLRR